MITNRHLSFLCSQKIAWKNPFQSSILFQETASPTPRDNSRLTAGVRSMTGAESTAFCFWSVSQRHSKKNNTIYNYTYSSRKLACPLPPKRNGLLRRWFPMSSWKNGVPFAHFQGGWEVYQKCCLLHRWPTQKLNFSVIFFGGTTPRVTENYLKSIYCCRFENGRSSENEWWIKGKRKSKKMFKITT